MSLRITWTIYKSIIMKKSLLKRFISIASALLIFSGCANDASPDISRIPSRSNKPLPQQIEEQASMNIKKVLENTYLYGTQLSYPITLRKLGKDFSIESTSHYPVYYRGGDAVACHVLYKNMHVGLFYFKDCKKASDITPDTEIVYINIGAFLFDEYDVPVISVYGVTIGDSHADLYRVFGNSLGIDKYYRNREVYTDHKTNSRRYMNLEFGFDYDEINGIIITL